VSTAVSAIPRVKFELWTAATGVEFVDDGLGGAIPRTGFLCRAAPQAAARGLTLAGVLGHRLPRLSIHRQYHDVASSDSMAFRIAARSPFKDAMKTARPLFLNP